MKSMEENDEKLIQSKRFNKKPHSLIDFEFWVLVLIEVSCQWRRF